VAVTPDGKKVYVANQFSDSVSVIATGSNSVVGDPIPVGDDPIGLAVTPDGSKVYVANNRDDNVSVIATATDRVVGDPIPVGGDPVAFGLFIGPERPFAGTPGTPTCATRSLSAAARRYGGTSAAARALGYGTVAKMQTAIRAYCKA
jgi:YVTN family beta-propeller protein